MDISDSEILEVLEKHKQKDLLRFVVAGSIDDGKSTLIGRLLLESKGVYEDQLTEVRNASGKAGSTQRNLDLALITDGLKAEREQGITIDVAYRYFSTTRRKFIITDTPGHEQYTRNMITGASTANLIVILIDVTKGVVTQSKRHAFIASLLAVPHMVVVVNKMDLVGYLWEIFDDICQEFAEFAAKLNIRDITFIPTSALEGDNVTEKSDKMPWYTGRPLLDHLENVYIASDRNLIDLRFPVQLVLRPEPTSRIYLGTVASGVIRKNDEIVVLPSGRQTRITSILSDGQQLEEAYPPLSVGLLLEDALDISRGDMLVHMHNKPHMDNSFDAMVMWMGEEPMTPGSIYAVKHTTKLVSGFVSVLRYRINVDTLHREEAENLRLNEIGRCTITLTQPVPYDPYVLNRLTGTFIIIDRITNATIAAGIILHRNCS